MSLAPLEPTPLVPVEQLCLLLSPLSLMTSLSQTCANVCINRRKIDAHALVQACNARPSSFAACMLATWHVRMYTCYILPMFDQFNLHIGARGLQFGWRVPVLISPLAVSYSSMYDDQPAGITAIVPQRCEAPDVDAAI